MKLTQTSIKRIRQNSNNALTKRVCSYVIAEWSNYSDKKNIFVDVLKYGCQSGTVGFLIYYNDTVAFYKRYKTEINELLVDYMENTGIYSLSNLFGSRWENEDPLAIDVYNRNLLAWFGFEETLRNIGYNFDELENSL